MNDTFDQLAQEIYRQKQTMDALRAENEELHRQIDELRDGRGIYIVIGGQRYPLRSLQDAMGNIQTML
jgi:cell division protein FtsB